MKRHAIDCKKIGESKTSPGFYKYEVTIQEKDGNTHVQPAYGRDMQDAISRLVWNERAIKVSSKKTFTVGILIGWLFTIIVPAIISSITASPVWILLGILFSVIIAFIIVRVEKYFNKNKLFKEIV